MNADRNNHWYRQPIAWLGIAITLAILAGCVWTIVLAGAYTDRPAHGPAPTLLGMPLTAPPAASTTATP